MQKLNDDRQEQLPVRKMLESAFIKAGGLGLAAEIAANVLLSDSKFAVSSEGKLVLANDPDVGAEEVVEKFLQNHSYFREQDDDRTQVVNETNSAKRSRLQIAKEINAPETAADEYSVSQQSAIDYLQKRLDSLQKSSDKGGDLFGSRSSRFAAASKLGAANEN